MKRLLPSLVAITTLFSASVGSATQLYMQRLPNSTRFRCLNCHTQDPSTTGSTALNSFGEAFKANGFQWDRTLAEMRSDGDNCTNGFELGDENGDGRDAGVNAERGNPGEMDCTLQLTETAWTELKKLFR